MTTISRVKRFCCDCYLKHYAIHFALLLAAMQAKALVIMDEKLGRNMAEYMGLQVTGTLGILAKARFQGLIPSFSQAASQMREQGIYFHEGLVNRIATRLGEVN